MNKEELHSELIRIIPASSKRRSRTRAIGHALIELGLLTEIKCAYEDCIMPSRSFPVVTSETRGQDRWQPIIDHVVELWQGGNEMPSNFQLIHYACNNRKAARLRMALTDTRDQLRTLWTKRWQDSEYRDRVLSKRSAEIACDICGRPCKGRAGLGAHMRIHK